MPDIQAVVFDIGNVLLGWEPEAFYDREIGPDRRRALFAEVDLDGMNRRVDLGEGFRDIIFATADAHPDWAREIRLWHDRWLEMLVPVIQPSVDVLLALRARGVPVFALSNFGAASFDLAQSHYPFLGEFDHRYISADHGVIKPDPAFYEILETHSGVAPQNLLFTDDRAENIRVAAERGWQTHHFQDAQGWVDRLQAEGLLA